MKTYPVVPSVSIEGVGEPVCPAGSTPRLLANAEYVCFKLLPRRSPVRPEIVGTETHYANGVPVMKSLTLVTPDASLSPPLGYQSLDDAVFALRHLTAGPKVPAVALKHVQGTYVPLELHSTRFVGPNATGTVPGGWTTQALQLESSHPAEIGAFVFSDSDIAVIIDGELVVTPAHAAS